MRNDPTVICLHASGSSAMQWAALRAHLEPAHRVVAPDLHGHGHGPRWSPALGDIVAADAALVGTVIDAAPGDVHLVGHSYGAALALGLAVARARRVKTITLYEPVSQRLLLDEPGRRHASEMLDLAAAMRRAVDADDAPTAARLFVEYWNGEGGWQALASPQQEGVAARVRVFLAQFDGIARAAPSLAQCRVLAIPVLLLCGGFMHAPVRRVRDLLHAALPGSVAEVMPRLDHMGPVTYPSLVARRIARFIGESRPALRSMPLRAGTGS